jgi:hypothetical protein
MPGPHGQELLARLQAGEERALAELAATYGSKIYQLAIRYLKNKEDAEEVMQDVLYRCIGTSASFRGDAALSSWIYRITFNAAMSRLRTAQYQRTQDEDRQIAGRRRRQRQPVPRRDCRLVQPGGRGRAALTTSTACAPRNSGPAGDLPGAGACCATFRGCRQRKRARCCA